LSRNTRIVLKERNSKDRKKKKETVVKVKKRSKTEKRKKDEKERRAVCLLYPNSFLGCQRASAKRRGCGRGNMCG
jgi:hypothetical protein